MSGGWGCSSVRWVWPGRIHCGVSVDQLLARTILGMPMRVNESVTGLLISGSACGMEILIRIANQTFRIIDHNCLYYRSAPAMIFK